MGLTIYGIVRSRAIRTLWIAEELGIPYEQIQTDFSDGPMSCRAPSFTAVNPNAQIPVIDDDGFKLWESLAIDLYLAKKHADKGLYPKNLHDEAKCWQWTLWAATSVEGPIGIWGQHTITFPPEKRDPKQAVAALEKLAGPFRVLEQHLKTQPYLVGNSFSVADLNLAGIMSRALAMDFAATPAVGDWLRRCLDRPAAKKVRKLRDG